MSVDDTEVTEGALAIAAANDRAQQDFEAGYNQAVEEIVAWLEGGARGEGADRWQWAEKIEQRFKLARKGRP